MPATGDFWDVTNPDKPVCRLDCDGEVLDIPYDWTDACTEIGATVASRSFAVFDVPMEVVSSSIIDSGTRVLARIRVNPATFVRATHFNKKFKVTCHVVFSDDQESDQTLWYKLVDK